ncbi:MAG: YifB family Mg chelatase-like AAA ATPase [Paludibacteraceae bacterium]|nr:YifB family Mg chelatase-like AAA ATPase [Paludibacteraceae bacterium]
MLVKCYTAALQGINAELVTVEIHATSGVDFSLVGLPDNAVKESRDRIHAALQVNGLQPPRRSLTINMSPADLKKEGSAYDLPLAIGTLAATEQIHTTSLDRFLMIGELSLDGGLQPVHGVLPITLLAKQQGFKGIILPAGNAREAAVVDGIEVFGLDCLLDVVRFLDGTLHIEPVKLNMKEEFANTAFSSDMDFSDVRGQENVRRAMEVAAAGGHNMIMVGPPGAGKSMMAKRLPSILPPLTLDEALETTKIHSVTGLLNQGQSLVVTRPFRAPHHTITNVALVGGGQSIPKPGEISLAHNGVLFLDELPEFHRSVLEVLRQPLEDRKITVSRSKMSIDYPASFMLVAAMNPCPCGHYGDATHQCTCTPAQIHRYKDKISGPLLDRIDIQVPIAAVSYDQLKEMQPGESSASIRERVVRARQIQAERFLSDAAILTPSAQRSLLHQAPCAGPTHCNAQMTPKQVRQFCQLDADGDRLLESAMKKYGLSARAYDRILKVARTIADLADSEHIQTPHIFEAISYRQLDRDETLF